MRFSFRAGSIVVVFAMTSSCGSSSTYSGNPDGGLGSDSGWAEYAGGGGGGGQEGGTFAGSGGAGVSSGTPGTGSGTGNPNGTLGLGGGAIAAGAAGSTGAGLTGGGSTGIEIVDRLYAASTKCGVQNQRTVPVGWNQAFNASGCSIYGPASFQIQGNQTGMVVFSQGESSALVGSGVPDPMLGIPQPTSCTPAGVADYFLAAFESWGCRGARMVWGKDDAIVVVTDSYTVRHSVFTCDSNAEGHPSTGYMFTMATPSFAGCSMVVQAYGLPQTAIETSTCTLSQILASVQCPTSGGSSCDDTQCQQDCAANGSSSGACGSDDGCHCSS